jgi:hypothetical protein
VKRAHRASVGTGSQITIEIGDLYNLHDLTAAFPAHQLTARALPSHVGDAAMSEQCLHCGLDAPPLTTTTGQTAGTE